MNPNIASVQTNTDNKSPHKADQVIYVHGTTSGMMNAPPTLVYTCVDSTGTVFTHHVHLCRSYGLYLHTMYTYVHS